MELERSLVEKVDLCIVSSEKLLRTKSPVQPAHRAGAPRRAIRALPDGARPETQIPRTSRASPSR